MAGSDEARSEGFSPVVASGVRVLILGSLPGVPSLHAHEYYANPRNVFWRIVGELTGLDPESPYATKCRALTAAHIGLWDVLASSVRPGSLDSSIDMSTVIPNNFNKLLSEHAEIRTIGFNGNKSRDIFDKRVFAGLNISRIPELITLPSTSPAHASMPYEEKLRRWAVLGKFLSV